MTKIYVGDIIGSHGMTATIKRTNLPEGSFYIAEVRLAGIAEPIQALARDRNTAMAIFYDKIAQSFRDRLKSDQS